MDKIFSAGKGKNRVFAIVFILIWGGLTLFNFIKPDQEFSQAENRTLSSFPYFSTQRLLDGDFMDDMNTYLSDQFAGRPYWVAGYNLFDYAIGQREINDVYVTRQGLYRHYPAENETISNSNIQGINAFAQTYGMPTTVMLVPSSTYIYQDRLPFLATAWDEGTYIEQAYAGLSEGIKTIDATAALKAEKDSYIYYRTDHHWTSYGAYLAYLQLAEVTGLPNRQAQLQTEVVSDSFLGTNHSRTGIPFVQADTIERYQIGQVQHYETTTLENNEYITSEYDSMYFSEFLTQKDQYSYFLGRLQPYVTITTGAQTGKKLIIFKDSYAHCLVPMLMEDYSEIRLVDIRSLFTDDYGALVDVTRYDEALFLYSTDVFSQQLGPARFDR